jgi:hypothetical protein
MPVIYDTAPVVVPPRETVLVKYLDLTKFLSLLYKRSLFFCRLDKLEDQFEGTTAKRNYEWRIDSWKSFRQMGLSKVPLTDDEIVIKVEEQYEFEKKLKAISCVNCWNKKETESAALWKIYSDFGKGILIKSSVLNIENALQVTPEEIRISAIKYIDYENELMPDGNSTFPLIHKNDAYSYENEVRLIYQIIPEIGWDYDWTKEENQNGKYIKVDLNLLIDEIIIGPFSPSWLYEMIADLIRKYNIDKPIKKSKL